MIYKFVDQKISNLVERFDPVFHSDDEEKRKEK
jgi:hypothetical protein